MSQVLENGKIDDSRFALLWNQIISHFRSEDLISNRWFICFNYFLRCCVMHEKIPETGMFYEQGVGFDENSYVSRNIFWHCSLACFPPCLQGILLIFHCLWFCSVLFFTCKHVFLFILVFNSLEHCKRF